MKETTRQFILLVSFMALLAAVTLFLFEYAPNPIEVSQISKILGRLLDKLLELFNIFNYL